MKARLSVSLSIVALLCATASTVWASEAAGDCSVPISLGKKPEMNQFGDYTDFLVAIMGYKKKERDQKEHRKACPELYSRPPIIWDATESLEIAVAEAVDRPEFDYVANPTWYDKTTSKTISLQDVEPSSLSRETISTSIAALDIAPPLSQDESDLLLISSLGSYTDDGSLGQETDQDFAEWLIFSQNQDASSTSEQADSLDIGALLILEAGEFGALSLVISPAGSVLLSNSHSEVESCLSSCGEFELTIGGP